MRKRILSVALACAVAGIFSAAHATVIINMGDGRCGVYEYDKNGKLVLVYTIACQADSPWDNIP